MREFNFLHARTHTPFSRSAHLPSTIRPVLRHQYTQLHPSDRVLVSCNHLENTIIRTVLILLSVRFSPTSLPLQPSARIKTTSTRCCATVLGSVNVSFLCCPTWQLGTESFVASLVMSFGLSIVVCVMMLISFQFLEFIWTCSYS